LKRLHDRSLDAAIRAARMQGDTNSVSLDSLRSRRSRFYSGYLSAPAVIVVLTDSNSTYPSYNLFDGTLAAENLMIAARHTKRKQAWDMEEVFTLFPILRERINNKGNQLSGGELQMLAIGRALISNPDFILMDEPSEGLAPLVIQNISHVIQQLKESGLSILLAEQNLPLALGVSDYVYVLAKGTVVFESSPGELENNEEVKKEYLAI